MQLVYFLLILMAVRKNIMLLKLCYKNAYVNQWVYNGWFRRVYLNRRINGINAQMFVEY